MKISASSIVGILLLPSAALAAIGGRCSHVVGSELDESWGICITRKECDKYGGDSSWVGYCPNDGNSVRCCFITDCDKKDRSICNWTSKCPKDVGKITRNHCPGGDNYACCNFN
ncbi:hypothetical protein QBC42DRAFT_297646 [Cladorrhinum samala]|uniref:Uncharacterized protein n=1 Tax=Cladorrhinum samala TaxID=585594 RepID=A0AAV9HPK4_9PEZI|nr:hypothetical protein QBC42DRAFT_297646 [Cladorrhinum samala]